MLEERYDSIEYDEDWQTVQTVQVHSPRGYSKKKKIQQSEELDYWEDDEYNNEYSSEYEYGYVKDDENVYNDKREEKRNIRANNPFLLIKVQLVICLIIVLAAFVLKNFGGNIYTMANNWYNEQINNSLIITQESEN